MNNGVKLQWVMFLGESKLCMKKHNTWHQHKFAKLSRQTLLTRVAGNKKPCKMHEGAANPFDKGGMAAGYLKDLQADLQSTLLSRAEKPPISVAGALLSRAHACMYSQPFCQGLGGHLSVAHARSTFGQSGIGALPHGTTNGQQCGYTFWCSSCSSRYPLHCIHPQSPCNHQR